MEKNTTFRTKRKILTNSEHNQAGPSSKPILKIMKTLISQASFISMKYLQASSSESPCFQETNAKNYTCLWTLIKSIACNMKGVVVLVESEDSQIIEHETSLYQNI